MPRAILLKTKSTPTDPYDVAFREKTPFIPVFVPSILENEPHNHYSSLIITSQRAVEGLANAMTSLTDAQLAQLRAMIVYTVGPATALAIAKLHFSTILGADTGNGTALATKIVQTCKREKPLFTEITAAQKVVPELPLLFLVGDKRRDIIPKRLSEENIPLEELLVYETTVASTFEEELDQVLNDDQDGEVEWIVFFSPSGAEIALEKMKKIPHRIKVATIGPTTEEYLRTEWNLTPDVVSAKPEPNSMVLGILNCLDPS